MDDAGRVDLGPQRLDVRLHRGAARDGVLHPVVRRVARRFELHHDGVRQPLRQHRAGRFVTHTPRAQFVDDLRHFVGGHAPPTGAARHDERFGRFADVCPDGTVDHGRPARVPLEHGDSHVIGATHDPAAFLRGFGVGVAREEGRDRRVAYPRLAERREHGGDVVEERRVRADDEDAGAIEPCPEGVEQPRGAVQTHCGLTGAGRSLDADGGRHVRAHESVLLGLDGRDDVAHRAGARSLDLFGEDRAAQVAVDAVAFVGAAEVLVLVGGQFAALDAESSPQADAHGLGGRGPVERRRNRCAPVDDERVAVLVGDVSAPDVELFLVGRGLRRVGVVDATEEEGCRRVVGQGRHAPGKRRAEGLTADGVARLRRIQGQCRLPHPGEVGARPGEVFAFVGEDGVRRGCGHG